MMTVLFIKAGKTTIRKRVNTKLTAFFKLSLLLSLVFGSSVAVADTAQMDTTLLRVNTLLSQINPLINLAAQQQDPNARVQFQFTHLRDDVARIQAGIAQALHRVTIQPRVVQPLSGDYLPAPQSVLQQQTPIPREDTIS